MKKYIIGLGAIAATITPVVAVVSCGHKKNNTHVEEIKVTPQPEVKISLPYQVDDVRSQLEAMHLKQAVIDSAIEQYKDGKLDIDKFYSQLEEEIGNINGMMISKIEELATKLDIPSDELKYLTISKDRDGKETVYASNIGNQDDANKICKAFNATRENKYYSNEYDLFVKAIIAYNHANSNGEYQEAIDALQKAIDVAVVK